MSKDKTREKKREHFPLLRHLGFLFPPVMLFAVFLIAREYKSSVSFFTEKISDPIRMLLGRFNSRFSFSVAEIIYGLLIFYAVLHIVITVIKIKRRRPLFTVVMNRLVTLFTVIAYIVSIYSMLFGIDYYKPSFAQSESIEISEITDEKLYAVASYFLTKANEYAPLVARDSEGSFSEPLDNIFSYAVNSYDGIVKIYPSLKSEILRPKAIYFSKIMSYAGFTGVYFPFTGESNINIDSPHAYIPATIAHELAHQKGITDESECNFIGILAATTSDNAAYIYSGYLTGLVHLMNNLAANDVDMYTTLRGQFCPELEKDWTASSEYWSKMDLPITHLIDRIYDAYLKSYGITSGVKSYSECVKLLVTYYISYVPIIPDSENSMEI